MEKFQSPKTTRVTLQKISKSITVTVRRARQVVALAGKAEPPDSITAWRFSESVTVTVDTTTEMCRRLGWEGERPTPCILSVWHLGSTPSRDLQIESNGDETGRGQTRSRAPLDIDIARVGRGNHRRQVEKRQSPHDASPRLGATYGTQLRVCTISK